VSDEKNIAREVLGVLSGNIATLLIGFITSVIISRMLGPELKGSYTTLLVIPGILSSFVMLGSRNSIIFHVGNKIYNNQQVISAVIFLFFISCFIGIILFLTSYWFFTSKNYGSLIISIILCYIPIKLGIAYSGSILLANLKFKKANQLKWMTAFLTLLSVIIFVLILKWSITGTFISLLMATFIVLVYALYHISREFEIKIQFDKKVISKIVRLGLINAIALVVIQLNFRVDILIMNYLSTEKEIGYYSVGVSIAEKLWQLPFAVGVVLTSRSASSQNAEELEKDVSQLLRVTFLIILIAAIFLYFLAPYLIPLFFGKAFYQSIFVVQTILPGVLFFVIVRILSSSLAGLGKTYLILLIFVPALLINILLNFIWIPEFGGIGAAWATNISYILGATALLIVYAKQTNISLMKFFSFERDDLKILQRTKKLRK
jgi:O-antigen/teichoic acid export membrane protein